MTTPGSVNDGWNMALHTAALIVKNAPAGADVYALIRQLMIDVRMCSACKTVTVYLEPTAPLCVKCNRFKAALERRVK